MMSDTAVSYTHLDVYKRQQILWRDGFHRSAHRETGVIPVSAYLLNSAYFTSSILKMAYFVWCPAPKTSSRVARPRVTNLKMGKLYYLLYHIICFLWKRDLPLSQICDVDFSFSLSRPGILQQFSGIAGRMPHIGDEKIAALHHISVCADDGKIVKKLFCGVGTVLVVLMSKRTMCK